MGVVYSVGCGMHRHTWYYGTVGDKVRLNGKNVLHISLRDSASCTVNAASKRSPRELLIASNCYDHWGINTINNTGTKHQYAARRGMFIAFNRP